MMQREAVSAEGGQQRAPFPGKKFLTGAKGRLKPAGSPEMQAQQGVQGGGEEMQ